jgi:prepilin-type N-terminal cleavage/methylation domain-containing protein
LSCTVSEEARRDVWRCDEAMQSTGQRKGFSLIELLVVLAIISLFAAVAVPTLMSYRSRRNRDIGDAALVLRSTLRIARTYAIQYRVRAAVFLSSDRYHVEYEDKKTGEWDRPLGNFAKDVVLPDNARLSWDTTVVPIHGVPAHIFDQTGTLDSLSALKAIITISDTTNEADDAKIEILRATGRVRIQ